MIQDYKPNQKPIRIQKTRILAPFMDHHRCRAGVCASILSSVKSQVTSHHKAKQQPRTNHRTLLPSFQDSNVLCFEL